jgi:hypothetical protein
VQLRAIIDALDRARVADAAAPPTVPELHHRRGPCPGQARFTESWQKRLERIGLDRINLVSLSINYPSTSSLTGPLDWAAALTARIASATTAAYCRSDTSA